MYIGKTCVLFIRATFLHLLLMWEGWETNRAKVSSNHILPGFSNLDGCAVSIQIKAFEYTGLSMSIVNRQS